MLFVAVSMPSNCEQLDAASSEDAASADDALLAQMTPSSSSLFQADAVDGEQLSQLDCHLRNVDFCYAGLMGSAQKVLPESDAQFEARCDEMKAASSCLAHYNHRCQTVKLFAFLTPIDALQSSGAASTVDQLEIPEEASRLILPNARNGSSIKVVDLMKMCEPQAKSDPINRQLRARLFELAKCINKQLPQLRPCIEDLKTALQLSYEVNKSLAVQPSCCALSRFRECSESALDNICGLHSFRELSESLQQSSGPNNLFGLVNRVCKQAARANSQYCQELLPASGLRAPIRRGSKASKLAKALDLISFSPAIQTR